MRDTYRMAKIRCTFSTRGTPEQTQAWFVRDVAPELHRIGGFGLDKEMRGCLFFSDRPTEPVAFAGGDGLDYGLLGSTFPHRLRVTFSSNEDGTKVIVHGRAVREIRDQIHNLLRRDEYWPHWFLEEP